MMASRCCRIIIIVLLSFAVLTCRTAKINLRLAPFLEDRWEICNFWLDFLLIGFYLSLRVGIGHVLFWKLLLVLLLLSWICSYCQISNRLVHEEAISGLCLAITRCQCLRALFFCGDTKGRLGIGNLRLGWLFACSQIIGLWCRKAVISQMRGNLIFISIVGTSKESGGGGIALKLGFVRDPTVELRRGNFWTLLDGSSLLTASLFTLNLYQLLELRILALKDLSLPQR